MYDITGIGNPLLDTIITINEEELKQTGLRKGSMTLVSEEEQERILEKLRNKEMTHSPGGSVANALAAASIIGGKTLFIGMTGKEKEGELYERMIQEAGITSGLRKTEKKTGRCISLITEDTERTMMTYLGACTELSEEEITEEEISKTKTLLIEAYQFDTEKQAKATMKAIKLAKKNNVPIALDAANPLFVENNKELLKNLFKEITYFFANEEEAKILTGKEETEEMINWFKERIPTTIIKLGEKGSIIINKGETHKIKAYKVKAINTTGAGDAYAGALIQGINNGWDIARAGKIASYVAAKVVASNSSRVTKEMKKEIDEKIREIINNQGI